MNLDWNHPVFLAGTALILARAAGEVGLERLNARHVAANADALPQDLSEAVDAATHRQAVEYTLAKSRLAVAETGWDTALLLAVLWSGVLPRLWELVGPGLTDHAWGAAGFLFLVGAGFSAAGLPLAWYAQFLLEERFGFNRTKARTWWLDHLKGFLLGVALLWPLLALVLKLVEWTGPAWWLWAWAVVLGFQVVLAAIAPVVILPLFNRLTPLGEGPLRERLLALADRTRFAIRDLQVMDGSKRSSHSNAFFAGLGRLRRIVLFDTLIGQLSVDEVEAVVAHEIGHYRRRHVPKMLGAAAVGLLAVMAALGWLARQETFYAAFGFEGSHPAVATLLFGLLGGSVTFWVSPLLNRWSRRFEYEADAFAAATIGRPEPLVSALRKLFRENLSNLTPHPWYSAFHYSHPTLREREQALGGAARNRDKQKGRTDGAGPA
jgi:STE24 endopeptidase